MALTRPPVHRFELPKVERNGLLSQQLPPEILQLILEHILVPELSLTIPNSYYQNLRGPDTFEAIQFGAASCQAQFLRTCQELYELGLEVWHNKAWFRLTLHCEGHHTSARTPDPFKNGKREWLSTCYGGPQGQLLLSKFQNIELELMPDWGTTDQAGSYLTWLSAYVIVDSFRFLNQHLRGKNLMITYQCPGLQPDRVSAEELGMWMGLLELLRCKSLYVPQFRKYMAMHQHTAPLALVTSDEDVLDLDEKRSDFLRHYSKVMNDFNAPEDPYYNSRLVAKLKERSLQCDIKEFIYIRNLFANRIDQISDRKDERPVEEDRELLEIADWYGGLPRKQERRPRNPSGDPEDAHAPSDLLPQNSLESQ